MTSYYWVIKYLSTGMFGQRVYQKTIVCYTLWTIVILFIQVSPQTWRCPL